jgi:hypothetical protein
LQGKHIHKKPIHYNNKLIISAKYLSIFHYDDITYAIIFFPISRRD